MTVVNPKSISGINSITMASGSDNLLTIHSNNTTERVRVDSSGNLTATSFSGDGSSLTGVASTENIRTCLLYTSPSPRDVEESRMPSSA